MSRAVFPFAVSSYSYTLSHTARECLTHLAAQGYTDFELMVYPGHLWPADLDPAARRALRADIAARGLRIVTLNMPNIDLNLAAAAVEMRRYTVGFLCNVVELAGDLGVGGVIIGPGKANPLFPAPRDRLVGYFHAALDELVPLALRVGTRMLVENMPFAFLPDADGVMRALADFGSDAVGVVYDVANGVFIGEDPAEGLRRVQARLQLVQVSDTSRTQYRHDPVGRGVVPFASIPPVLDEIGYAELPLLEVISQNADADLRSSVDTLLGMGWRATAARPRS